MGKFRFRFTLASMMVVVLGIALDFSLFTVVRKKTSADTPTILLMVVAYDFLAYFSWRALRILLTPVAGKAVSWKLKAFAYLHIGLFAGVPIAVVASAMIGLW